MPYTCSSCLRWASTTETPFPAYFFFFNIQQFHFFHSGTFRTVTSPSEMFESSGASMGKQSESLVTARRLLILLRSHSLTLLFSLSEIPIESGHALKFRCKIALRLPTKNPASDRSKRRRTPSGKLNSSSKILLVEAKTTTIVPRILTACDWANRSAPPTDGV